MAFGWQANNCPLLVVVGASLPEKKKKKKKTHHSWIPLTKLSGSAHEHYGSMQTNQTKIALRCKIPMDLHKTKIVLRCKSPMDLHNFINFFKVSFNTPYKF